MNKNLFYPPHPNLLPLEKGLPFFNLMAVTLPKRIKSRFFLLSLMRMGYKSHRTADV